MAQLHDTNDSSQNAGIVALFFSLIRCGIGKEELLPFAPTAEQWNELYDMATKQALQGIAFAGVERLPKEQRPPTELILKWFNVVNSIKNNSREMTRKTSLVTAQLQKDGFRNVILKGQGIAQYYPQPDLRVSGDIDVWVEGGCDKVVEYVRNFIPDCRPVYHHVDFPVFDDTGIELHYRPSWMYSPLRNSRLQKYFTRRQEHEFVNFIDTPQGKLSVPTVAFNLVYIPIHIYRHLFDEGIGMRQILDYYYVLQQNVKPEEMDECVLLLKSIGMLRFMQALMYVMQQMFALDKERMPFVPDAKYGRFLFKEIMLAGNFGRGDTRYADASRGCNANHFNNQFKRSLLLVRYFPSEILWNPLFKVWHMCWRARHRAK